MQELIHTHTYGSKAFQLTALALFHTRRDLIFISDDPFSKMKVTVSQYGSSTSFFNADVVKSVDNEVLILHSWRMDSNGVNESGLGKILCSAVKYFIARLSKEFKDNDKLYAVSRMMEVESLTNWRIHNKLRGDYEYRSKMMKMGLWPYEDDIETVSIEDMKKYCTTLKNPTYEGRDTDQFSIERKKTLLKIFIENFPTALNIDEHDIGLVLSNTSDQMKIDWLNDKYPVDSFLRMMKEEWRNVRMTPTGHLKKSYDDFIKDVKRYADSESFRSFLEALKEIKENPSGLPSPNHIRMNFNLYRQML